MAQPSSLRPPSNIQPRSKAAPTFGSSSIATKSTPSSPQLSTPSNHSRQTSPARSIGPVDGSDKSTATFIKRILCATTHPADQRTINELLPPLTSSNEVDLQLYAIVAVVVKDLVSSWYGKITPDSAFVEEVIKIIAHCTTQLESRVRKVDVESLLLDEIPELVERHLKAYRISHRTQQPGCLPNDPHALYHNLNPHPALSPVPQSNILPTVDEQFKNEAVYRQLLVQGALALLLPTEDLENSCLRTLVADVIADSILGNAIGGKLSEGWFIWSSINKLIDVVKAKLHPRATGEALKEDTRGRLEKFGLLSEKADKVGTESSHRVRQSTFSSWFWMVLQYLYLMTLAIRFITAGLFRAYSQPSRSSSIKRPAPSLPVTSTDPVSRAGSSARPVCRPLIRFKIFSLLSTLLDLHIRAPWLSGSMALLQHRLLLGPFQLAATDGILDQYIYTLLTTHFHPTLLLPSALQLLRESLFPGNTISTSSPQSSPSTDQIGQIKHSCAESLLELIPRPVSRVMFGGSTHSSNADRSEDDALAAEVAMELEAWGDQYCTKHLLYGIVELVVVRLLPELGRNAAVGDLVDERGYSEN